MALNQITMLRLPNGSEVALVDWSDKPLFSTVEILHGTTTQEINFFQYVQGDNVPAFAPVAIAAQRTANERDTNLAAPGAMASTEEMLIYSLRPEVWRRRVADDEDPDFSDPEPLACDNEPLPTPSMLAVLGMRCLLSLEISEKVFSQASFQYFNTGFGVNSSILEGSAFTATNGLPTNEAVRALAIPMHIGGTEKFRAFLTNVDDGTGDGLEVGLFDSSQCDKNSSDPKRFARITLYLDGLYKRPTT